MGISFLIPLNNPLFKNMPHIGSFWHFVICCICVFVYLRICIFVFACLTHGNIIFDILEQSSFQKICHMSGVSGTLSCAVFLYLCFCIFVFACLTHGNMIFVILAQPPLQKYTTCWVFLALRHMLYLCVCEFCICIFCICGFDTWNVIFLYP